MANIIESFEYFDYRPPITENINDLGTELSIMIYNEEIVTQPHKSLLVITGRVMGIDDKNDEIKDVNKKVNVINNGILQLFDRIDYYLGDTKIDSIRKPGISTTLKGLVSFENDSKYSNSGWRISNASTNILNENGYFSVCVPLAILMGFFEDYKKFLYRIPQKMTFYRTTANIDVTEKIAAGERDKFSMTLKDITWRMPQIKLSIEEETRVRKEILNNTNYELKYRSWLYQSITTLAGTEYTWDIPVSYSKTKYVLLAFQKKQPSATYDLLNLENVQILLNNNVYYPRERLNLKYSENKCAVLYQMFKNFKLSYYDKNEHDVNHIVDYATYLDKYPVVAIDCSYQPNVIKESLINIKVIFNWRETVQTNLTIHCVLIMDDKAVYNPLNNRVIR